MAYYPRQQSNSSYNVAFILLKLTSMLLKAMFYLTSYVIILAILSLRKTLQNLVIIYIYFVNSLVHEVTLRIRFVK